ncbi:hypothetical protein O181_086317 [Austropuccinia psidii MF-1]|uniref:Uncharacterized protein n=1 Tax=Austropuccinia psidii MF-1 TaxID=1389203 RepID=A0A9Q3FZK0_9BASI|nr:hypothetical protein [Austropuccinia psidii MF-1]
MPSTRSGASYSPSISSQKGHRRDYGRSQSVTEGKWSVDDFQINKLCHSEADNTVLASNRADTVTRSLSGHIQSQPEGLQQCIAEKRVPDPCISVENSMNSYPTVREFLGHPNTCKLLNGWHPLMGKKNMILLTAEWRKNNPPPPIQMPKTAPVASSRNSNVKKQPQAQSKVKGKAPTTKPYSQGYRIPNIQKDAMGNVFQMARTMMELQKKEEARLKYQKLFLTFLILSQSCMNL